MNRAFTLIELMIVIAIIAIIAAIAIPSLTEKKQSKPEPTIEADLSFKNYTYIESVKVLVLPTGERALVVTGCSGTPAACLLPPLPKKVEVEK